MKFASTIIAGLLLAEKTSAFVPQSVVNTQSRTRNSQSSFLNMALDMPPPAEAETSTVAPVQQNAYGQPTEVRYSEFLKLVQGDKVEKVTFSADGTQLLGVDVDGARIRIEALPNDPELLTQLTSHKVCEVVDD